MTHPEPNDEMLRVMKEHASLLKKKIAQDQREYAALLRAITKLKRLAARKKP